MLTIDSTVTLNNGVEMPLLGLGVFQTEEGEEVENAVRWALDAGYRHIDTASLYRNERGVGTAVRASGLPREDLFITTKVWNTEQGYETTIGSFEESLRRLGMDYVDLFLVHWPSPDLMADTWRAMEAILASERTRAIGVSNFLRPHLDQILEVGTTVPAVNQVEFHPHNQEWDVIEKCREHNIAYEAWSPLKRGQVLNDPTLGAIAAEHGKATAQVILRWMLQEGIVTIPKSVHAKRIEANADLYDFALSPQEVETIRGMNRNERIGPMPGEFF